MCELDTKPAYEAMSDADLLILVSTNYPCTFYINHKIPAIQIDLGTTKIGHRHNINLAIMADDKSALALLNKHGQAAFKRPFLTA